MIDKQHRFPFKIFKTALLILFANLSLAQNSTDEMQSFLKRSTVKVDSASLISNIRQFLFFHTPEGTPIWFDGSVIMKSGYELEGLRLKFNLFDNSVYVKSSSKWYKVSNSSISGFTINREEGKMKFRKGYGLPYQGLIEVTTTLRHQEIITYLKDYPDFNFLNIRTLIIEKNDLGHKLSIDLETKSSQAIFKVKNYLIKHDAIANVDSEYLIPELNENVYIEILFETDSFAVIKHHYKKIAQIGSVSLSQHKSVFMFDEKDYYISSKQNILTEFLFNKSSIEKCLYNSGVDNYPKVKKVGSEKKLILWLNQNFN